VECSVKNYETYKRPESQGGNWILADIMKVNRVLSSEKVIKIRNNSKGRFNDK
jgi:hypothetical protein